MTGIVLAGTGTGMLITPPVASWLISAYDWRTSYITLGILVLVVVVLTAQFLRRDPSQMGQVPYGESKGGDQVFTTGVDSFSFRDAVHTRQLWLLFTIVFSQGFSSFIIMVHIVPHATDLGISAISAATILATVGGLSIVGRVVLGNAADRIGNRRTYIICFILMSIALFWLAFVKEVWMLYLFAVVFGFAIGGTAALGSPLVARLFGLSSHGLIFGFTSLGLSIGGAVGPLFAGYIFDVTASYQLAFLICAVFAVFGIGLTLLLKPIKSKQGENLEIA